MARQLHENYCAACHDNPDLEVESASVVNSIISYENLWSMWNLLLAYMLVFVGST